MVENGKELLKQHIKHKRVSEGLTEITVDLFAKRPRYEMAPEELFRTKERRQKNKEAAEKSRKRKKEEFFNLQTENDQLQQDKCQLVAVIEGLKSTMNKVTKENKLLRYNTDHLKRWIGKHASELGLGKHTQKRQEGATQWVTRTAGRSRSDDVLRGNPYLYSAGAVSREDVDQHLSSFPSPSLPSMLSLSTSPPVTASPPATPVLRPLAQSTNPASSGCPSPQHTTHDFFQPVGIRTVVRLPQPPVPKAVEKPLEEHPHHGAGQQQEVMDDSGQKVVYFPKNSVFIVQGEDGQQVMMVNPELQQQSQLGAPEEQKIITTTQHVPQIVSESSEVQDTGVKDSEVLMTTADKPEIDVESSEIQDTNVETTKADVEPRQTVIQTVEMQSTSRDSNDLKTGSDLNDAASKKTVTVNADSERAVPIPNTIQYGSLASSIDVLLKFGCTIQLPEGVQLVQDDQATPMTLNLGHQEQSHCDTNTL